VRRGTSTVVPGLAVASAAGATDLRAQMSETNALLQPENMLEAASRVGLEADLPLNRDGRARAPVRYNK
jgi:hypothetical protein